MAAAIFPNPKRAHKDGPMKWCKTCSRHHRSRQTCPLVVKGVTRVRKGTVDVVTSLRLYHAS